MRHPGCTVIIGIRFLLGVTAVLTVLFFNACTSMQEYRESPDALYRGYTGPSIPKEEVATVWWHFYPRAVSVDGKAVKTTIYRGQDLCPLKDASIDEKTVNVSRDGIVVKMTGAAKTMAFIGAELLPGRHTMEVCVRSIKAASATITIEADLSGGHVYSFKYDSRLYAKGPAEYSVSLIDEETGSLVAGRPPEILKWKWSDLEQALKKLKRDSATEKQAIELLSEPWRRLSDSVAVYLVCRNRGLISRWPDITIKPPANCGMLFVEFDKSGILQDITFVDVDFRKCFRSPFTAWDAEAWHREYAACSKRLQENAYAEFRTLTGNPAE
jgi:hypothetical protein